MGSVPSRDEKWDKGGNRVWTLAGKRIPIAVLLALDAVKGSTVGRASWLETHTTSDVMPSWHNVQAFAH
jgi:hypothetical protein